MAAVELYKKKDDGTIAPCGIFFCSQCRLVYETKEKAEWCHGEHLCACGKKVGPPHYEHVCDECRSKEWRKKEEARESERFEKATKIKASEYTGDHVMDGDNFYESVEDAIDQYEEGQEPEYVWACKTHGIPKVDMETVTCNILDNMWEDAEESDLDGLEELQAALDAFNKANESIQLWEPDYSIAILVEAEQDEPLQNLESV